MSVTYPDPVVYYARMPDDLVKIGTSVFLGSRMRHIGAVEVLAVEPGSMTVEQRRHRQFSADCAHGEFFRLSDRLLRHITSLQHHPIPDLAHEQHRVIAPVGVSAGDGAKPTLDEIAETLKALRRTVTRATREQGSWFTLLHDSEGWSVRQIAEASEIPKSTVHRLMTSYKALMVDEEGEQ